MAVQPLTVETLVSLIPDVSTADEAYFRVPSDGRLEAVYTVLHHAITNANAVLTVKQTGSAAATLGTITITQDGSAIGDVDSLLLDTAVVAGDLIEVEGDGGSTTAAPITIHLQLRKLTA